MLADRVKIVLSNNVISDLISDLTVTRLRDRWFLNIMSINLAISPFICEFHFNLRPILNCFLRLVNANKMFQIDFKPIWPNVRSRFKISLEPIWRIQIVLWTLLWLESDMSLIVFWCILFITLGYNFRIYFIYFNLYLLKTAIESECISQFLRYLI